MECKCGGQISRSSREMSSEDAQVRYPYRPVPKGYSKLNVVEGECKCGRYAVDFFLVEKAPEKVSRGALW